MKKLFMLVGVAVVAGAMYVAAASGSQQSGITAKQFKALKAQVAGLSKKVNTLITSNNAIVGVLQACMQGAVPIGQFGDGQSGTFGYHWYDPTDGEILTSALDVASSSDPNALWFPASQGTGCKTALGGLRHNAAKSGFKLGHFTLPQTFAAHRH